MRLFSIFLFLIVINFSYSQRDISLRDSIIKYEFSNPNLAIEFGLEYIDEIQSKKPDSLVVGTYAKIGSILSDMGLFGSSLSYYNRAIELYNTMPDSFKTSPDVKQPPWIILNIGSIYFKNGDLEKAEEKYYQALKIFKSLKNKEDSQNGINTTESNLGLIDEQRGKFIEAEKKYLKIYERRLQNDKHEDIVYHLLRS